MGFNSEFKGLIMDSNANVIIMIIMIMVIIIIIIIIMTDFSSSFSCVFLGS